MCARACVCVCVCVCMCVCVCARTAAWQAATALPPCRTGAVACRGRALDRARRRASYALDCGGSRPAAESAPTGSAPGIGRPRPLGNATGRAACSSIRAHPLLFSDEFAARWGKRLACTLAQSGTCSAGPLTLPAGRLFGNRGSTTLDWRLASLVFGSVSRRLRCPPFGPSVLLGISVSC